MELTKATQYGGSKVITKLIGGKFKTYLGIAALTIALGMAGSIVYLQNLNESKSAEISNLNNQIGNLLSERARIQKKLELQDETHDRYRLDIKGYQKSLSSLKNTIKLLKEKEDENPEVTIRRINAVNIECLSALSEGSTSASDCSPQ